MCSRRLPSDGADLREVEARPPRVDAAALRHAQGRGSGGARAHPAAAPAGALRAGARPPLHRALDAQLRHRHRLLPARQLHDEAQPARQRAARDAARVQGSPSAPGGGRGAGRARADVAPAGDPEGGRGPRRVLAAAGRGVAGRADRPDADARVLRGHRRGRAARHDHHRRHGARHEPRVRDDGRLQAREGRHRRPRQPRPRRPAREGERADGRADAHEPLDARALRRGRSRRWRRSSTTPARSSTTTART